MNNDQATLLIREAALRDGESEYSDYEITAYLPNGLPVASVIHHNINGGSLNGLIDDEEDQVIVLALLTWACDLLDETQLTMEPIKFEFATDNATELSKFIECVENGDSTELLTFDDTGKVTSAYISAMLAVFKRLRRLLFPYHPEFSEVRKLNKPDADLVLMKDDIKNYIYEKGLKWIC